LAWHRDYFEHLLRRKFSTGEASANYFYYPSVPEKISNAIPGVRLILLLRNPVDRAYSDYQLSVQSHKEIRSFEEAIRNEISNSVALTSNNEHSILRIRYLVKGMYADHLERWLRFFRREDLLILKSEDFFQEQSLFFQKVIKHIGLPIWEPNQYVAFRAPGKKRREGTKYPSMTPDTRKLLIDFFKPSNERLSECLGTDVGWDN
jgi:hypothetical protein